MEDEGTLTTADNQDTTLTSDTEPSISNWREMIPEDIRKSPVIEQTKDITSMAKQLVNAQQLIGKGIKIPDNGDTSGWNEVYNKLGRPEKIEGYKVARPDVVEGIEYNEAREKSFLEAAHAIGLNSSQVNKLIEWNQGQALGELSKTNEAAKDAASQLKHDWGAAFKERLAITERIIDQYGGDDAEVAVRDNPALIRLVYELGKNLVEGTAVGEGKQVYTMSPQEALNEINRKMRDPGFMSVYNKANAFGHDAAVEEMAKLNQMAYPEAE